MQVGEISMIIESAVALARDTIRTLHRHAVQHLPLSIPQRLRIRAAVAFAPRTRIDQAQDCQREHQRVAVTMIAERAADLLPGKGGLLKEVSTTR